MVDYSKWNNFHDSDEDEEDEEDERRKQPLVHHFDQPTSITIGPNGTNFQNTPPTQQLASQSVSQHPSSHEADHNSRISHENINTTSRRYDEETHSWQQTRYDVTIWIQIPFETKVSEIQITLQNKVLLICLNSKIFFEKEFKYDIQRDPDGDLDWEVLTDGQIKQIKLICTKHQYLPGSTIWWSLCFLGDHEIDVMSIPERNMTTTERSSKQSFSEAWREANELFQKKIKSEKIVIEEDAIHKEG